MGRVIIISNRVLDLGKAAQSGGVAVAIADVLKRRNGLWFGWNGKVSTEEDGEGAREVKRQRRSPLVTVPLSAEEHRGYYLGYSNTVLWPVFHNRLDLAEFDAGFFAIYSKVNERFARILKPHIKDDDLLWVHDYHLIPFALELRKIGVANPIGFFLHIPFPPAQTFLAIPEHRELSRAFAAYDLIGLQTKADVANMLNYIQQGPHGSILQDGRIRVHDQVLTIASFPVGIDIASLEGSGRGDVLVQARPTAKRIIGIDRLDYSKGLPNKFRAFGRFLENNPGYRGNLVLTQIAPPTRESVEAYADIRTMLETLSGSINGRFGELDWVPIHYIHRSVPRKRLADIYRASHIGLVTPLRDGMNLVAKEYVAAQNPDDPGVLILSQFAGAAEEMSEAVIVNPYNTDEMADAIRIALEMKLEERKERHAKLLAKVERDSAEAWSNAFLDALQRAWSDALPMRTAPAGRRLSAALGKLMRSGGVSQPPVGAPPRSQETRAIPLRRP